MDALQCDLFTGYRISITMYALVVLQRLQFFGSKELGVQPHLASANHADYRAAYQRTLPIARREQQELSS